ncbi:hypothetical protein HMPREF9182_1072 [Streptococcus sp. oral taxon 056 str. F0418]|nr:hypothetical protein HMPREF9182_1072 [Streptococcus sp. oral taxon 056 str. F0418]
MYIFTSAKHYNKNNQILGIEATKNIKCFTKSEYMAYFYEEVQKLDKSVAA